MIMEGEVLVRVMAGSYEVIVLGLAVFFAFYGLRRLNGIERLTTSKMAEGEERLNALVLEIVEELKEEAVTMIDEELPNAFEQIDLMRQQMITQGMGWGMNLLMQKFGGDNPPELIPAEIEQKD